MKKIWNVEDGFSLIEVVASIGLLTLLFGGVINIIIQNNYIIDNNQLRAEAMDVQKDIKEYLTYRGQTQDIADLNRIAIVDLDKDNIGNDTKERSHYLILDNSGIQKDENGNSKFDEKEIDASRQAEGTTNAENFIRKVSYEDIVLPSKLNNQINKKYMGNYLDREGRKTNFLIRIDVLSKDIHVDEGLNLKITIWDQERGNELTTSIFKWIIKY